MVHLFSQNFVPSTIGVLVLGTASSLPSRLKINIYLGTLQRGFLGMGDCSHHMYVLFNQKLLRITELSSEEPWKVALFLSKIYLLSAYYRPGSVQVLYIDELIYMEEKLLPSVWGWGNCFMSQPTGGGTSIWTQAVCSSMQRIWSKGIQTQTVTEYQTEFFIFSVAFETQTFGWFWGFKLFAVAHFQEELAKLRSSYGLVATGMLSLEFWGQYMNPEWPWNFRWSGQTLGNS